MSTQYSAPSVVYPVGRCRLQAWRLLGMWVISGVGLVAWLAHLGWLGKWPAGLALVLWLALGWGAWAAWCGTAQGQLRWDGQAWQFHSHGYLLYRPCSVHVHLHGGTVLGLRLTRPDSGRWIGTQDWVWAHEDGDPAHWLAFRRAVYSPPVPVHRAAAPRGRPNEVRATGFPPNS